MGLGYEEGEPTRKSSGAIDELDNELERLDKSLTALAARLAPITTDRPEAELASPRPEPATELRARVERLRNQVTRLDRIRDDIDL